jgi:hypothetical protein
VIVLLCSGVAYVGVGLAYTRYVKGDSSDRHGGLLRSHPHHSLWLELPTLVSDGWRFARWKAGMLPKEDWVEWQLSQTDKSEGGQGEDDIPYPAEPPARSRRPVRSCRCARLI